MVDGKATRITVRSTLTAVSSRPVQPGITRKLSQLDYAMRPHSSHVVFYYRNNPLGSFELDPLRMSLAEVLSAYPLVTGRLNLTGEDGQDWELKCNDAGVRVLRATVSVSMDEWLRSADGAEEKDLTVWEDLPDDPHIWSPFRIQLNEFEDGGIAIGISCTHMIADLTSIALLFKSWTDVRRNRPIEFLPSFLELPISISLSANTRRQFSHHKLNKGSSPQKVLKMATFTFKFSEQALDLSIKTLCRDIPGITPFDFLAATFWTSVTRMKTQTGSVRNRVMSIAMDCRKLSKTPQPLSYFGNSVHFSALQADDADLRGDLHEIIKLVHDHVSGIVEAETLTGINGPFQKEDTICASGMPIKMYGHELTCVNMEHLVVKDKSRDSSVLYEAAFNDGDRPLHVSCSVGNAGSGGVIIIVPEKGLARMVHVTLPEEEMGELLRDKAIAELKPTLLLSGAN